MLSLHLTPLAVAVDTTIPTRYMQITGSLSKLKPAVPYVGETVVSTAALLAVLSELHDYVNITLPTEGWN